MVSLSSDVLPRDVTAGSHLADPIEHSGLAAWPRFAYLSIMAFDRIQIDPTVCNGKPTIRGLRFTVDFVLKLLGDGYTAVDITREYPELQLEDVYQAAKYGAWLASEQTFAGL